MPKSINITNERYSSLTAISKSPKSRPGRTMWLCRCDCGNMVEVYLGHLRDGHTKSCGCKKMVNIKRHNMSGTPLYVCWQNIVQRTQNPNHPQYKYWGGRGITLEPYYRVFDNFFADMGNLYDEHVLLHGRRQTSIDRIDNNKGYERGNLRWATQSQQNYNRRASKLPLN